MQDHSGNIDAFKHVVDGISAGAIIGAIVGFLPPLAALLGAIWYGVQIYESKTFQGLIARFKR